MKSTETATRRIVLTNNGKYAARFDFELRRLAKEVFSVEPSSGELEPGAAAECAVVFDVSKTSDPNARRAKLVDAPDIVLTVAELEPAEEQSQSALALASARTKKARDAASLLEKTEAARRAREKRAASKRVVVHASVDASFAEYALTPRRGVDFGPHLPGAEFEAVGARFFDVTNHGAFPFEVFAFDYGGREGDGGGGGEVVLDERGVPAPPPKPEGESLSLGAFVVSPVSGVVEPGSKLSFEVRFAPSDDRAFSELLGLHVENRDPRDQPLGIPYKLHGESVAPGVDAGDAAVAGVFEEHEVIERDIDAYLEGKTFLPSGPNRAVSAVYSRRDGAFGFGAVTAEMEASGVGSDADLEAAKTEGDDSLDAETKDADKDGDSSAAPQSSPPPLPARAVTANFKISNPKRVRCVVDVALTPLSGDESDTAFPMALLPGSETLVIEPRTHAFVSVVFAPRALQKYAAALAATVRDGAGDKRLRSSSRSEARARCRTSPSRRPRLSTRRRARRPSGSRARRWVRKRRRRSCCATTARSCRTRASTSRTRKTETPPVAVDVAVSPRLPSSSSAPA
jgi:hydrocephalus-inducing protein